MPTYSYHCLPCDHRFDAFHKMAERDQQQCPRCHDSVQRLPTAGAFSFKDGSPTSGPTRVTRADNAKGVDQRDIPYVDREGHPRDGHTNKRLDPKDLRR